MYLSDAKEPTGTKSLHPGIVSNAGHTSLRTQKERAFCADRGGNIHPPATQKLQKVFE
jgi:hypothetical protein